MELLEQFIISNFLLTFFFICLPYRIERRKKSFTCTEHNTQAHFKTAAHNLVKRWDSFCLRKAFVANLKPESSLFEDCI